MNCLKSFLTACLLISFCFLSSGCKEKFTEVPSFPYENVKTIAVCPIAIQPTPDADGYPIQLDQEIMGRLLAEEMIKFQHKKGIRVMYPAEVIAAMQSEKVELKSMDDVKELGQLLNVDAICLLQINQFSDFTPKRLTLSFYLFETNADSDMTYKIVNLGSFGTPDGNIDPDNKVEALAMIQRQWDASSQRTQDKAKAWANRLDQDEEANWQRVLQIKDEFFRMCFHYTIREYVRAVDILKKTKAPPGKHPFKEPPIESHLGNGLTR